jgi:hypothetical protein
MSLNRREFMQALAFASAGGMSLQSSFASAQSAAQKFYNLPKFGNVHLLHFTDCHAQLLPIYFREPNVNLGIGSQYGKEPHLVGEAFLKANGIKLGTRDAHAFTYLDFAAAAASASMTACCNSGTGTLYATKDPPFTEDTFSRRLFVMLASICSKRFSVLSTSLVSKSCSRL